MGVSPISFWEIALLHAHGRIRLARSLEATIEFIETHRSVETVAPTGRIALDSTRLGANFPRDPADRLIAATARCHGLRLMTADDRIRTSGAVAIV